MGKDGDNILLDLLKESDQKAFKRLFYSYAEPLKTFIQYFIHNPEVAEELVLDIFTSLWENREHLDIQTSLKAYLFQAARNKVASYFRSKKDLAYLEEIPDFDTAQDDVFSLLEVQELSNLLEEAVSLLPERCREIFAKSRYDLLSNKELAENMNISEKTVENQITIALKKIRKFLDEKYL